MRPDEREPAAGKDSTKQGQPSANQQGAYLGACAKHFAARAVGQCDDCGEVWCSQCLVPPTRKRKPTRCIECALVAAGVRAPGPRRSSITSVSRNQRRPTNLF